MKSLIPLAAVAATLLAAAPAAAQLATKSDAPVDITADELEVVNASCIATWKGNAEALQDTARLRADVIKIFNTPGPAKPGNQGPNCGTMQRMEATGSVYYVTTDQQRVRANAAVYVADSQTITMTGDVVMVQGQNVLRGDKMVYNTETGQGQMEGGGKGKAKVRPRGVFYPKSNDTTSAKPSDTTSPKSSSTTAPKRP
jgi:lipopolysaccharide export system protein LptA